MSPTATTEALENVAYEKKESIAYVTVNRPKVLNALNAKTIAELRAAFEDARDDAAVRGVILSGAGGKAFVAGADIAELARVTAVEGAEMTTNGQAPSAIVRDETFVHVHGRERETRVHFFQTSQQRTDWPDRSLRLPESPAAI